MPKVSAICVYCGASEKVDPKYKEYAKKLGHLMVQDDIALVYGGSQIGLMGATADAVLEAGGRVYGVLPEHLQTYEKGHDGITQLTITKDMHQRKKQMFKLAEAFVVMPGGFGTMDETFEIITWRQLRLHNYPVIIVNVDGYWDELIALFDGIIAKGFASEETRQLYHVVDKVEDVIPTILAMPEPTIEPKDERI